MNYDREILRILTEVGDRGLSVAKISRHVHHACNSLFTPIDFEDVHKYVAQYLLRNSKNPDSIIEKTDRGVYHLNLRSQETQQLMLQFAVHQDETESKNEPEDLSLSLF